MSTLCAAFTRGPEVSRFRIWYAWAFVLAPSVGCLPALPDNTKATDVPLRTIVREADGATFSQEDGVSDALWLEIARSQEPGSVGGYLSQNDASADALIILLHGASTFSATGGVGAALLFHQMFGPPYRDQGYLTLSLVYRECGTAYGQGDVADVLEVLDWLNRGGKVALGVDRVYIIGYSTGGTITDNVCRQRSVAAAACISGLSEPRQLTDFRALYQTLAALYPDNEGFCQLGTTLLTYGPPGSSGWDTLNTVGHVQDIQNPMIFFHGNDDIIYNVDNTLHLQNAYESRLADGVLMPEMQFVILDGVDHFMIEDNPDVTQGILDFFARYQ
jgi:dienelactone hydrolase